MMRRQLLPALRMVLVLTALVGLLYPLAMTGVAQALFKSKADGSIVTDAKGQAVGSALLGQSFSQAKYFWPRPSAAGVTASGSMTSDGTPGDVSDLSLSNSGGSNLGPTNDALISSVADRVTAYRSANGLSADTPVPVDAVTASASGVDPHISVANAQLQAGRVAEARGVSVDQVHALIDQFTDARSAGVLGEPGVNVLLLNLALDRS